MLTLLDPFFYFSALLYGLVVMVTWMVPGVVVLQRVAHRWSVVSCLVLSLSIGMGMWGAQSYVLGYLHLRVLTYVYVGICILLTFLISKKIRNGIRSIIQSVSHPDTFLALLICVGVLIQVIQVFGSGLQTRNGMSFFRVNSQDGVFHLSLIESITRTFPPMEPGASKVLVANYHYWSDMILAEQARIFHFSIPAIFFQYFPIVISLFTALSLVALLQSFKANKVFTRFALFFLFFSGDAAYLFMLWLHHIFGFFTPAIDNGATQFLNVPHSVAKLVFFTLLIVFVRWIKEKKISLGILVALLSALLFGLKIYFALYAALGLGFVFIGYVLLFIWKWMRRQHTKLNLKKEFWFLVQYTFLLLLFVVVGLGIYLPPNHGSGGLGYYPLEWPKLLLNQFNLDWRAFNYRYAIYQYYHNTKWLVLYDLISIGVTLISIHGTRIVGFLINKRQIKFFGWQMILYTIPTGILFTWLGLYTLQSTGTGAFNVYNFFSVSLAILVIYTAFFLSQWWQSKNWILRSLVLLILLLSIPRVVFETNKIITSYIQGIDVTYIPQQEQQALAFINAHTSPESIVQSDPSNFLDSNTPYVSYFSNRQTYITGENVLETHGQPTKDRYDAFRKLFDTAGPHGLVDTLKSDGVGYLYVVKNSDSQKLRTNLESINVTILYENSVAVVYKL